MRCVVLAVVVSACGPERILEVADTTKTLEQANASASADWSVTGGSLSLSPTGSNVYPLPLTLRLRFYERCGHDDGDECEHDLRSASVKPLAGSPCAVTIATACSGATCFTELQVDGLGNCLLQVHVETVDGETDETCWHRAVYEADDPFDQTLFAMYESKTDDDRERCADSL